MVSREGDKAKILASPLSRLNGEHGLWVGNTTNVVTESDLWMSALLSHSGSSFKVFLRRCVCHVRRNGAGRVIFGKAWWQHGILWGFFIFYYNVYINAHSSLSALLVVHMYHTPAHACYEICSLPSAAAVSFCDAAAWILTRLAGTFPVSHMGCFCIFLSLSRTNTDNTNINTHTHTQSDMHTNTFLNLLKDRLWCAVFCLWRFHYFFNASPSSAVTCVSLTTRCSATETPANTVSSDLNVPVLQSHFQLCFNGFCIRGGTVEQLPWVKTWKDACVCEQGLCVHASIDVQVLTRVQLRVSVYSTDKLLDSVYFMTVLAEICFADGSSDY